MQALVKISKPQWFIVGRNLKTAKALGLDVPHSLLARADEGRSSKTIPDQKSLNGNSQVALVAIELEGLKHTCRYRTVWLATGSDHSRVRGARRCSILCEPHIYRLAVPTFTVETILVDREDFGAVTIRSPAWQRARSRFVFL